jgi:hypothetical protein
MPIQEPEQREAGSRVSGDILARHRSMLLRCLCGLSVWKHIPWVNQVKPLWQRPSLRHGVKDR